MFFLRLIFLNRVSRWLLKVKFPKEIKATERSLLLQYEFLYFASVLFTLWFFFQIITKAVEFGAKELLNSDFQISFWIFNTMALCLGVIVLNKDLINGQGVVNRYFGYRVVDVKTGEAPVPIKSMLRNVTLILYPFEFLYLQRGSDIRIGDQIAGTKLIKVKPVPADSIFSELKTTRFGKEAFAALAIPLIPVVALLCWILILNLE